MCGGQAHPFEIAARQLPGQLIGSQLPNNWCPDSATEIGRKTAKTARDAKMFDATECWEYVATVYRDILPGNLEWIAIHWQMLESAQNWSPNGTCTKTQRGHGIGQFRVIPLWQWTWETSRRKSCAKVFSDVDCDVSMSHCRSPSSANNVI